MLVKMIAMLICAFVAIVGAADLLEGLGRIVPTDNARHQAQSPVLYSRRNRERQRHRRIQHQRSCLCDRALRHQALARVWLGQGNRPDPQHLVTHALQFFGLHFRLCQARVAKPDLSPRPRWDGPDHVFGRGIPRHGRQRTFPRSRRDWRLSTHRLELSALAVGSALRHAETS